MPYTPHTNTGHGHVWKRPDGVRMRCGGPGMCSACSKDLADKITQEVFAAHALWEALDKPMGTAGLKLIAEAMQETAR
jgi:hypothetical protein